MVGQWESPQASMKSICSNTHTHLLPSACTRLTFPSSTWHVCTSGSLSSGRFCYCFSRNVCSSQPTLSQLVQASPAAPALKRKSQPLFFLILTRTRARLPPGLCLKAATLFRLAPGRRFETLWDAEQRDA